MLIRVGHVLRLNGIGMSGVKWHDRSDDADVVFIVDPLAG
jgi:hypothetical protein